MTARVVLRARAMLSTSRLSLLVSASLLACAAPADHEPPDLIVDGKADTWGYPTKFGKLFERTWQFGQLDPSRNLEFPAWEFSLSDAASVTIATQPEPSETPELASTVIYLYKQRDVGTFQRIAKMMPPGGNGFATLTKDLGAGTYRVLVKGMTPDASGRFLVRLGCGGAGCAPQAQCMVGQTFHENLDIKEGSLVSWGSTKLTIDSERSPELDAQIIAAVHESSHTDVTTIAEAFDRVDQNEVYRYAFWNSLTGRRVFAIEYGAGDNSYGGFFVGNDASVVAAIHDGEIYECTLEPRGCLFGEYKGDAAFMPEMTKVGARDVTSPTGVSATLAKQIIKSLSYDTPLTLAEAIEATDDDSIYVEELEYADGSRFVGLHYHLGDTPVGHFFPADTDTPVAEISDGQVTNCDATY